MQQPSTLYTVALACAFDLLASVMEEFTRPASATVLSKLDCGWQANHRSGTCTADEALTRGSFFSEQSAGRHVDLLRAAAYYFAASCLGNSAGDDQFKKLLPQGASAEAPPAGTLSLPYLWKTYLSATQQEACDSAAALAEAYSTGCPGVLPKDELVAFQWHVVAAASSQQAASAVKAAEALLGRSTFGVPEDEQAALGLLGFARQQGGAAGAEACLLLGACAASGTGMRLSRLRALLFWRESAWLGPSELVLHCKATLDSMQISPEEDSFAEQVQQARAEDDAGTLFALGARTYQGSHGLTTDNELAYVLFQEAARQDHPRAMSQLGFMSATGRGTEKSEAVALQWLRRSAEAGHGTSMFNYARQCDEGRGLPDGKPDHATAIEWYERAAAGPYPTATHNLALTLIKGNGGEARRAEGLHLLRTAADPGGQNLVGAQSSLGLLLESGRPALGIERDAEDARQFLQLAFKRHRYECAVPYARCLLWGRGGAKSFKGAADVLITAMEEDNNIGAAEELLHWSIYGTGGYPTSADKVLSMGSAAVQSSMWDVVWTAMFALSYGKGKLDKDPVAALQLCRAGVAAGETGFHAHMAFVLYTGLGCDVDFEGARASALVAAEHEYESGMTNYAEMLWQGMGGVRDVEGALQWQRKAAEKSTDASAQLAIMLTEREAALGVDREQPSLEEQTAAAALGSAEAMLWLLHRAFLGGKHLPSNNDDLASLLVTATNGGTELMPGLPPYVWTMYAAAQSSRGHSVAELPQGPPHRKRSLLRAAEAGCSCAAYCVGMKYLWGRLFSKRANPVMAGHWLRKAHELGHPQAAARMQKAGIQY